MEKSKNNFAIRNTFGERLRLLRKKRGFTQGGLAEKLGYKTSVPVSNIENGVTLPNLVTLTKIADVLHIDLHWLITGMASETVIYLKLYVSNGLISRQWKMLDLKREAAELGIRQSMGEDHGTRLEQISDELQKQQLHYEALRKALNELLEDVGESI